MRDRFSGLEDEELWAMARAGHERAERALVTRYRGFVAARARSYYLNGAERDDLLQEGLIGLTKAIRDYVPERGMPFGRFAHLCVSRQIISAVRTATRQKHQPMAAYATLSGGPEGEAPLEPAASSACDPNAELLERDGIEWIKAMLKQHLSGFEKDVLTLYLRGRTYREIADSLARTPKAIDNALSRIKEKGRALELASGL